MFRITRPLFQVVLKSTAGPYHIAPNPNALPELKQAYESTLSVLELLPPTSLYRQSVSALTQRKLGILQTAKGDVKTLESELDEGQIEHSLGIANDELKLAAKMLEWKAWEPLQESPAPGQWEYIGQS